MKKVQYAKPLMTHGDFKTGNLYEVVNITEYTIEVKVKDKQVIAKKDNFEIVNCIFNDKENDRL